MARKRDEAAMAVVVILFAIISFVASLPGRSARFLQEQFKFSEEVAWGILIVAVLALVGLFVTRRRLRIREVERRIRALQIANIDCMTGIQFEAYLQRLLAARGFDVQMTKATGDLGVDLIAHFRRTSIAIQVKRSNRRISRRAISDAVAGMQHYRCKRAMVITNSYFTPGAILLAKSTNCARW